MGRTLMIHLQGLDIRGKLEQSVRSSRCLTSQGPRWCTNTNTYFITQTFNEELENVVLPICSQTDSTENFVSHIQNPREQMVLTILISVLYAFTKLSTFKKQCPSLLIKNLIFPFMELFQYSRLVG
jgi:hypothetical protein